MDLHRGKSTSSGTVNNGDRSRWSYTGEKVQVQVQYTTEAEVDGPTPGKITSSGTVHNRDRSRWSYTGEKYKFRYSTQRRP